MSYGVTDIFVRVYSIYVYVLNHLCIFIYISLYVGVYAHIYAYT